MDILSFGTIALLHALLMANADGSQPIGGPSVVRPAGDKLLQLHPGNSLRFNPDPPAELPQFLIDHPVESVLTRSYETLREVSRSA